MSDLTYQPLNDFHLDSLLPIWSDEEVIKFTNIQSPCTLEDVHSRIKRLKIFDVFVVLENENVIGIIGCPCINKETCEYGIFYQFRQSVWGKGVATTAVEWLLQFMEHKYPNARLFADVVADNIPSEKILNRVGFHMVSEESVERNGITLKVHNYIK